MNRLTLSRSLRGLGSRVRLLLITDLAGLPRHRQPDRADPAEEVEDALAARERREIAGDRVQALRHLGVRLQERVRAHAEAKAELPVLEHAKTFLGEGRGLWEARLDSSQAAALRPLNLLTMKPVLYAANVSDQELANSGGPHMSRLRDAVNAGSEPAEIVPFSAKIEAELSELPPEERGEFLASLGVDSSGLDRLIRAGYHLLGLQTYFTAAEQEVRAWTIHQGDTAPIAAGVVHSDFERGFIRAETVSYEDFVASGGWKGARERGVVRSEGRDYVVKDGDVMLFRFNV
jgi:ribosome-binding ATPase